MKPIRTALLCAFASCAMAQYGGYLGPGVLSRGAGDIGQASGNPVDLRFYATISGVYDNGIHPFALTPEGNLVNIGGLYGVQLDLGAYGVHQWRQSELGLNYSGDFYHYENAPTYDGSSHNLTLGYTYQKSHRLAFDFRVVAGTSALGYGVPGFYGSTNTQLPSNVVDQPTALLFDNRIYYTQVSADVDFILSPRTILVVGGEGYLTRYSAAGLASLNGWSGRASLQRTLSRTKTLGFTFQRLHFEFPPAFGSSDENMGEVFLTAVLGPRWTFSISGGAFESHVQGVRQVALSPVVAALLGETFGEQTFNIQNIFPSGSASLTGKFKTSLLGIQYGQTVVPGNGVYLTSRQQSATLNYSYTALRKWNLGASGGYFRLQGIGQNISPYTIFSGGAGFTYSLTRMFHIIGRYDYRHQQIAVTNAGFNVTGSRATLGLSFSPGNLPLTLW